MAEGLRVYAIGDIHGRLDLLEALLARIEQDAASAPGGATLLFLGDLMDRGPHSAQVVERLRLLASERAPGTTRFLAGNHEEVFLTTLAGDEKALRFFLKIGGRETILSYGMAPETYRDLDYPELLAAFRQLVPQAHIDFVAGFEEMILLGDYAFVHAGIRPELPLDEQTPKDLRWIRDGFLDFTGTLDKVVVHGHTITDHPVLLPHRIGLDTGAYASGTLTAMAFEADRRWLLQTGE